MLCPPEENVNKTVSQISYLINCGSNSQLNTTLLRFDNYKSFMVIINQSAIALF